MPVASNPDRLVPDHLAGWYPGDLDDARAAHAGHTPSGLPAHRAPAPRRAADVEPAPAEGGRFLAAWYAGDVESAARAAREHGDHPRMGRTTG